MVYQVLQCKGEHTSVIIFKTCDKYNDNTFPLKSIVSQFQHLIRSANVSGLEINSDIHGTVLLFGLVVLQYTPFRDCS